MPVLPYNPFDWYWIVAGDTSQIYSSRAVSYIPPSDPTYQVWLAGGNQPAKIPNQQELIDVLVTYEVPVPAGAVASDTLKESIFDKIPRVIKVWSFDVDNRVRVLEGQPARTANQFKNYVKGLI